MKFALQLGNLLPRAPSPLGSREHQTEAQRDSCDVVEEGAAFWLGDKRSLHLLNPGS